MEAYTIVANTKGKADVWRHFGLRKCKADGTIVEKTAACLTCNTVVKTSVCTFFYLLIRFWCVLITTGIVYTHRINVLFLVICVCTLGIKYCHHYILFLSLCRHVFDAFSCNIHHEERYLKFADISFENIDTAKKYRDNIDTFLRRYPSPSQNKQIKLTLHPSSGSQSVLKEHTDENQFASGSSEQFGQGASLHLHFCWKRGKNVKLYFGRVRPVLKKNSHIRKNLTQKWWTSEIQLGNAKKKEKKRKT